jgi:Cu/Ag efflux protein CusF
MSTAVDGARTLVAVALLALLASACSRDREYAGRGEVVSIDEPRLHVVLRHEDIPGLMRAMTMRLAVVSQTVLDGIEPGDVVDFVLLQRGGDLTVISIMRRSPVPPSPEGVVP